MKIVNKRTPKAKIEHICDLCGQPIKASEQYLYVCYREERNIKHTKVHPQCWEVAEKMQLLDSDKMISSYWFERQLKSFLIEVIRYAKKPSDPRKRVLTTKEVRKLPVSALVPMTEGYFQVSEQIDEQKKAAKVTEYIAKAYFSISTALFAMPECLDDLEEALDDIGKFKHATRVKISAIREDFVAMSAELYSMLDAEIGDDLYLNAGDVLAQIREGLSLDPLTQTANTAICLMEYIKKQCLILDSDPSINVSNNIYHVTKSIKDFSREVKFIKQPFVQVIVDKAFKDNEVVIEG